MKRATKVLMILAMILAFTSGVSASTFIQWGGRKDYNYSLEYIKQIKSTINTKNQTIAEKENRIIELEELIEQGNSNKELEQAIKDMEHIRKTLEEVEGVTRIPATGF